jgi:hypothetical protein
MILNSSDVSQLLGRYSAMILVVAAERKALIGADLAVDSMRMTVPFAAVSTMGMPVVFGMGMPALSAVGMPDLPTVGMPTLPAVGMPALPPVGVAV